MYAENFTSYALWKPAEIYLFGTYLLRDDYKSSATNGYSSSYTLTNTSDASISYKVTVRAGGASSTTNPDYTAYCISYVRVKNSSGTIIRNEGCIPNYTQVVTYTYTVTVPVGGCLYLSTQDNAYATIIIQE